MNINTFIYIYFNLIIMPTKCQNCSNITPSLTQSLIYTNKMNNKICLLCNLVDMFISKNNNIIDFTDNIIICLSSLNQKDIIELTYKYFKEHNKIPYPSDLDKNVIILDYPVYLFNQIYNIMNDNDRKKFNVKIFFTNVIDRNMLKVKKITESYYPIEKISSKYHENKKKLDKSLDDIYYLYYSSINNNKYI